jgi:hypothetical protein
MKAPVLGAALVAALTGSAVAEVRYDRNLEQAVLGIVKQRIGEIRGPLAYDAVVILPEGVDGMATGSVTSPSMRSVDGAGRNLGSWIEPRSPMSSIVTR